MDADSNITTDEDYSDSDDDTTTVEESGDDEENEQHWCVTDDCLDVWGTDFCGSMYCLEFCQPEDGLSCNIRDYNSWERQFCESGSCVLRYDEQTCNENHGCEIEEEDEDSNDEQEPSSFSCGTPSCYNQYGSDYCDSEICYEY